MIQKQIIISFLLASLSLFLLACTQETPSTETQSPLKVGVIITTNSENDKSFNDYTLKGAKKAAEENGVTFVYNRSASLNDYARDIEKLVTDGADLIIATGFPYGDPMAQVARKYPETSFAIIDNAYFPGFGCPETVNDCYTEEGGLNNITSMIFAEDEVAYLAGVLAACVSKTGTIANVAGAEIPPVIRFVKGFDSGAKSVNADIVILSEHIPDFNDPELGKIVAHGFINQNADVIFATAGNTGNGALLAAKEANIMAIGVDVDQYFSYPEVKEVLISSAMKKIDTAAAQLVENFVKGELKAGIELATLANEGIGLAPYHDWQDKIPQSCKDQVIAAEETLKADPSITGAKP